MTDIASLAALLRTHPMFGAIYDDTASPTQRQMDEHDTKLRQARADGLAEWLLARGVQYAPREPHLEREGNHIRGVGFSSGPLAPDFVPSHLSKGASPPREPPPEIAPCGCSPEELLGSECRGHRARQAARARGRPEGPSTPPKLEWFSQARAATERPYPSRDVLAHFLRAALTELERKQ